MSKSAGIWGINLSTVEYMSRYIWTTIREVQRNTLIGITVNRYSRSITTRHLLNIKCRNPRMLSPINITTDRTRFILYKIPLHPDTWARFLCAINWIRNETVVFAFHVVYSFLVQEKKRKILYMYIIAIVGCVIMPQLIMITDTWHTLEYQIPFIRTRQCTDNDLVVWLFSFVCWFMVFFMRAFNTPSIMW